MAKKFIAILGVLLITSCFKIKDDKNGNRKLINKLLKSEKPCDIIEANFIIGETRDSVYIDTLFRNIYNSQVCPGHLNFKGMSVYQSKVGALKKIIEMDSILKINSELDSSVVNVLLKRYIDSGLIKKGLYDEVKGSNPLTDKIVVSDLKIKNSGNLEFKIHNVSKKTARLELVGDSIVKFIRHNAKIYNPRDQSWIDIIPEVANVNNDKFILKRGETSEFKLKGNYSGIKTVLISFKYILKSDKETIIDNYHLCLHIQDTTIVEFVPDVKARIALGLQDDWKE